MIELVTILLSLTYGMFQWYYSEEHREENKRERRDKAIAEKDHMAKSKHLSDLLDFVHKQNNSHSKR